VNLDEHDLTLIKNCLMKHFTRAQLEQSGYMDRSPDRDLRVQLAELDTEFFAMFYLGHHFPKPFAPVHHKLFEGARKILETPGRQGDVTVFPRGFGKTTIVTLAYPAWVICFGLRRHILIISDSFDQAKEQLTTLKHELTTNERIAEDFGALKGPKWDEAEIVTATQIKVVALGARMKIRGRKHINVRPDLMIVDDIENLKNAQSPTLRDQLDAWFRRDVVRAGWDDTKIFVVGNFLHHDCLLARLVKNPMFHHRIYRALVEWPTNMDLWDQWKTLVTDVTDALKDEHAREFFEKNKPKMLEGAISAWPEAYPVYDLMTMWVSEGDASFQTEMQNNPSDPSKRLFKHWGTYNQVYKDGATWLVPNNGRAAVKLTDCTLFAFTDPSLGKTSQSDFSAMIILAKARNRQQFVLEANIKRRSPEEQIRAQLELGTRYKIMRWGIEANFFQALFSSESAKASLAAGVHLPIVAVIQQNNKDMRIQSLQPDLENEYILLAENGQDILKQQLEEYVPGANYHDDGPDALEASRTLAKEWEPYAGVELVQGDTHQFNKSSTDAQAKDAEQDPFAEAETLFLQRLQELLTESKDPGEQEYVRNIIARERASQGVFVPTTYL
jgi:predicted phage terminase large subunit-like protein